LAIAIAAFWFIGLGIPLVLAALRIVPSWPWSYLLLVGTVVWVILLERAVTFDKGRRPPAEEGGRAS